MWQGGGDYSGRGDASSGDSYAMYCSSALCLPHLIQKRHSVCYRASCIITSIRKHLPTPPCKSGDRSVLYPQASRSYQAIHTRTTIAFVPPVRSLKSQLKLYLL